VDFSGHLVLTTGKMVCFGMMTHFGHFVDTLGQSVLAVTHAVSTFGQLVWTTGHLVVAFGQAVLADGHAVFTRGHRV
jgi:hypothetical protein